MKSTTQAEKAKTNTFVILAGFILVACQAAPAGEATAEHAGPPIRRLVWQAPQRIVWRLSQGPVWHSLGHVNRVLCFIPRHVDNTQAEAMRCTAIDIEVHEVTGFDPDSGLPLATRRLAGETVRADDPVEPRRARWPFPTEQTFDWEISRLPARQQQHLLRLFLHDTMPFWQTLMIHAETDTTADEHTGTRVFSEILIHVIVCELLHDPGLSMTSTYIEPDDPPCTDWVAHMTTPAPWSLNRERLRPASGSLTLKADGALLFTELSDVAQTADAINPESERHPDVPPDTGEIEIDRLMEDMLK